MRIVKQLISIQHFRAKMQRPTHRKYYVYFMSAQVCAHKIISYSDISKCVHIYACGTRESNASNSFGLPAICQLIIIESDCARNKKKLHTAGHMRNNVQRVQVHIRQLHLIIVVVVIAAMRY